MTLSQLRYFCAASRSRSVTKAAQELYVTQPTISLAIRELENEFNTTLFLRNGNRLELTKEGELFYKKASFLLQYSSEMQNEFMKVGSSRHPLRIGIPPMLSTIFFPTLLDAFNEAYPDIPVELDEFGSVRASELVQNERLDLAIANMGFYNIDTFNKYPLTTVQLVYCVYAGHPRREQQTMKMEDFEGERILTFNSDSVQVGILEDRFESLKIHPRIVMRCSQMFTVMNFVRQGDCGCFMYSPMLPLFPELIGIPLDPPISFEIGLVWKRGRYISNEMRRFISFTESHYEELFGE